MIVDFYTFIMMIVEIGGYIYYTIQVMRCSCYYAIQVFEQL